MPYRTTQRSAIRHNTARAVHARHGASLRDGVRLVAVRAVSRRGLDGGVQVTGRAVEHGGNLAESALCPEDMLL